GAGARGAAPPASRAFRAYPATARPERRAGPGRTARGRRAGPELHDCRDGQAGRDEAGRGRRTPCARLLVAAPSLPPSAAAADGPPGSPRSRRSGWRARPAAPWPGSALALVRDRPDRRRATLSAAGLAGRVARPAD